MTVTMSSEGDSSKSALSESNEKSGPDQNTDSSQDANDVGDAPKTEKVATENNIEKEEKDEKPTESDIQTKSTDKKEKLESDEKVDVEGKTETEEEVESEGTSTKKEKKPKKEKVQKEKEEEKSEKSEENSEKEDGSDKDVPLLDQPLEKLGKRERKNVQRFNEEFSTEAKHKAVEIIEGSGTALGDIPRIDASISRFKNEDLKVLHRILFKTVGKNALIKKNIRKFSGFDFKKDSEEYSKKLASFQKLHLKHLKSVCEMLDLAKSGTKDEIERRIIEFLIEPKDSGKPLDGGRPKRTAAVRANNRGYSSHDDYSSDEKEKTSRARRDKGKRSNLKDDSSSDEEFQPNSDGSDEKTKSSKRKRKSVKKNSSEEDESEASVASSDESDDELKAKRKKSPVKANNKSKAKATPSKRGRSSAPAKKTPAKGRKAKAPSTDEEEESDKNKSEGSSSEDEPLAKKAKSSQPPTDDEIKTFIKSILEGANLEEITMKTVCQRVYNNYPDFDLTHKKDFIKTTVKSLIST